MAKIVFNEPSFSIDAEYQLFKEKCDKFPYHSNKPSVKDFNKITEELVERNNGELLKKFVVIALEKYNEYFNNNGTITGDFFIVLISKKSKNDLLKMEVKSAYSKDAWHSLYFSECELIMEIYEERIPIISKEIKLCYFSCFWGIPVIDELPEGEKELLRLLRNIYDPF